jgi:glyoxylase-like metal-dependent hydrolase (beta-lactamase superfamily II)
MYSRTRLTATLFSLLATTGVVLARQAPAPDPLVRENATVRLASHTYAIPDQGVPLVPNVGIVVGSRATLVIDPGLGRRNGEAVLREVAKVSRNTELFIASTHFHAEHTTGYLAFPATAKYVNSREQEQEFAEGGLQMVEMFSRRSPATAEILAGTTRRVADITFDREYALDLGDVTVRMIVVGPAHTRADTVFFVEQDRVLFTGDFVMTNSFLAAGAAASMTSWLAGFDRLAALAPTALVPAHGTVGTGEAMAVNRSFMQQIVTRTADLKRQGRAVDDVIKTVSSELTAKQPAWPRANGIANAVRAAYREAP